MDDASLRTLLESLERELHSAECRQDVDRYSELLALDFSEFGRSGATYDRASILEAVGNATGPPSTTLESDDYRLRRLGRTVAQLTYRSWERHPDGTTRRWSRRSSIWQQTDGAWRLAFHQGTPTAEGGG